MQLELGTQWFSSLDLMEGYHQVHMAENSKCKNGISCQLGFFYHQCMLFGLTKASATFQHLMNKMFCGDKWNFVFLFI